MTRNLFSFPSLPAGPPSRRNWYQELLDHPKCRSSAAIVREVYISNRVTWLETSTAGFEIKKDDLPVTPDQALLRHLETKANGEASLADQDVNCMVIWARPTQQVLNLVLRLQSDLAEVVGRDLFPTPEEDVHFSVLELSHRHSVAHLRHVADEVSADRLQSMLDYASNLAPRPALDCPQVNFDKFGVALTFVPVANEPYTYHHLRSDLHSRLLESGISVDTCYTAASAHMSVARFVGNRSFASAEGTLKFLARIHEINQRLRQDYWPSESRSGLTWRLGEEKSFELQLGYLKFGRERVKADLTGKVTGCGP